MTAYTRCPDCDKQIVDDRPHTCPECFAYPELPCNCFADEPEECARP